jgi:hypothetical protein
LVGTICNYNNYILYNIGQIYYRVWILLGVFHYLQNSLKTHLVGLEVLELFETAEVKYIFHWNLMQKDFNAAYKRHQENMG